MPILAYLLARFSEPSSYAGLGAVLALAGWNLPDPTLAQKHQDASAAKLVLKHVRFAAVKFMFQPQQKEYLVPLSWKLSRQQKAEVEHAWQAILDDQSAEAPLAQVDRLFAVPSGAAGGTAP